MVFRCTTDVEFADPRGASRTQGRPACTNREGDREQSLCQCGGSCEPGKVPGDYTAPGNRLGWGEALQGEESKQTAEPELLPLPERSV